jgi:hypothetical protein
MDDEQKAAYRLALETGAKKTAAAIRLGKYGQGQIIRRACAEIGTERTVKALLRAKNPWWSFCAIRWEQSVTLEQRIALKEDLTEREHAHARWEFATIIHLTPGEKSLLQWILA